MRTYLNKKIIAGIAILACVAGHAQPQTEASKMQWFADAKLGVFIHWGVYAVNGIAESWSFFNNYVNYTDYRNQLQGFTAKQYNPQQWAQLIKASGAKYAVITSKHHDGVSLWNSRQPDALTIPQHSAAKKDVLTPFVAALKKSGLKTGIYYSLPDWSYAQYDVFTRDIKRYDIKKEPQRFEKFIAYYQGQLHEISKQFAPDLLWFDGDWEHSAKEWKAKETRALLQQYNPQIIINSRLTAHGDYATPEQGVPVVQPAARYWELCYTMNDSWGFQPFDNNYKTSWMLIRTLVDCMAMGGNLLLDIGPKADGTLPQEQIQILKDIGRWTHKHAEAIQGTQAGISQKYCSAASTLSKDKKTLYLYLTQNYNGQLWLKGVGNTIVNASVVGTTQKVRVTQQNNNYWLHIPLQAMDKDITVVKVQLDQPIILQEPTPAKTKNYIDNNTESVQQQLVKLCNDISTGTYTNAKNTEENKQLLDKQTEALQKWRTKHAEVWEADKGLPEGHYAGLSALSKDKQTLYLFVQGKPSGPIALKGIENNIARIRIVGDGTLLQHKTYDKLYWSSTPGIVYIDIPPQRLDDHITVVAVLLDGPLKTHRNEVKPIENNL